MEWLIAAGHYSRWRDWGDGTRRRSRQSLKRVNYTRPDFHTDAHSCRRLLAHSSPLSSIRLQSERYAVLLLFDRLFAQNREGEALPDHYLSQLNLSALKSLYDSSPSFLARLIEYFNGEKDPRNLMVVFSILRVPAAEWDLSTHAQVRVFATSMDADG